MAKTQCGIREQRGGERPISSERESWWAADEGNRSPSGKAASRPPLPQGLTHHGAPSDSFYLRLLPTLLLQLSSQAGLFDFLFCRLVSHPLTQKYFEVGFRYFDGTSGELK